MKAWCVIVVCFAVAISTDAAIIRVDSASTAASPNGSSWARAFARLQPALVASSAGDTIWVAKGTYYTDTLANRNASFALKQNVAVYGGFSGSETALAGRSVRANPAILNGDIGVRGSAADNAYHVVLGATQATLDGFTIVNGHATAAFDSATGAGMLCNGTSPLVRNCIFRANVCAGSGGGLYAEMFGHPLIENCWFDSNSASSGGGCSLDGTLDTVRSSIFTKNTGSGSGGGLTMGAGGLVVNCVFCGDSATYGGAMDIAFVNCLVTQCTFFKNRYGLGGGSAIANSFCNPAIVNCVLWDAGSQELAPGRVGDAPVITSCCIKGGGTTYGSINTYPAFADSARPAGPDGIFGTADDGLALSQASPCVNAGASGYENSLTDVIGGPRILARIVDMGAYEYRGIAKPWILGSDAMSVNENDTFDLHVGLLVILDSNDASHSLLADTGANYTVMKVNDTLVRIVPGRDFSGLVTVPVRVFDSHDTSAAFSARITVVPLPTSIRQPGNRKPASLTLSQVSAGRVVAGIPASLTDNNSAWVIALYDCRGALVWKTTLVAHGGGYFSAEPPLAIPGGAYIVRLQGRGALVSARCMVVR